MKRNKIRARILEELYKEEYLYNKKGDDPHGYHFDLDASLGATTLAERTNYSEPEIESQIIYLLHHDEIRSVQDGPDVVWYLLTKAGRVAYSDDKYAKLSDEEKLSRTEKRVTIWVTVLTLAVSTISIGINFYLSNESSNDIDRIESKVDSVTTLLKVNQ